MDREGRTFAERFRAAVEHARLPWSQTKLQEALGYSKQHIQNWMNGSAPRSHTMADLAAKLNVRLEWLSTGQHPMQPAPMESDLSPVEMQLISQYRRADPRWQLSLRLLAALATEYQIEAATDVNVVIARILGKSPRDIRPPTDKYVASKLGDAPHVAARKKVRG